MKSYSVIFILFFLFQDLLYAENRTALLMGSWEYNNSPRFTKLMGIEKDLKRMEESLQKQGFKVYVVKNPSIGIARGAIDQFGEILKKRKGIALFYFSGHGCEMGGHNYLIPNNNNITKKDDVANNAIDTQLILNRMQEADIETKLIFLDCCRVPFELGSSTFSPIKADGAFIGYATGSGKASEASLEGSLYTECLAKAIAVPKLSINDMHTTVTGDMKRKYPELGRNQLPYQYSGLPKIFYFAKTAKTVNKGKVEKMIVVTKKQTKSEINLPDGSVVNHYKLKLKISKTSLTKPSKVYKATFAGVDGLVALQFINGSYVVGSFFMPNSSIEIKLYGHNYAKGKILLSLWESGSPLDGGELEKVIEDGKITWKAKMASGDILKFSREQDRKRDPGTSLYTGKVGSSKVNVTLKWQKDGRVTGSYKSQASGRTYKLAGDNLIDGFLYLEEFTNGKLSARLFLHSNKLEDILQWQGILYNLDGPRREVSFIKN